MMRSITLRDIHKKYYQTRFALHINNLEFSNRDIHVIVGPNGSGKTSLLKLIALLDRPNRGRVLYDDKDIYLNGNRPENLRKKIGFVMQNPYLFNTDVFENIELGLKIRKYPRDEAASKVKNILAMLEIEHLTRQSVKCLSRGEYQKVAIAQVLVLEPEVILMDEPAANVDRESTLLIEEIIKNIRKKYNPIIIMTSHSLTQAYRVAPNIISIKKGKIADSINENIFEVIYD